MISVSWPILPDTRNDLPIPYINFLPWPLFSTLNQWRMLPLADIKYVEQLDLADELYLDVPDDEQRLRQLDVDPAVRPPHRVHVRHEGPHAGLPHLELRSTELWHQRSV